MTQPTATKNTIWKNIIIWTLAIAAIGVVIDFGLAYLMQSLYADTTSGNALTPFQNHYLSFTQPFLTSEFIKANDVDPGRWSRFFSEGIVVIAGWMIILFILRVIPATRNASALLLRYGTGILLVILFIHVAFFPKIKSVFNQHERKLIITRSHYYFLTESQKIIPFDQITGFESEWMEVSGFSSAQYAGLLQLYANTGSERIFIGETRVDSHMPQDNAWKERAAESQQVIANEAIHALEEIIK